MILQERLLEQTLQEAVDTNVQGLGVEAITEAVKGALTRMLAAAQKVWRRIIDWMQNTFNQSVQTSKRTAETVAEIKRLSPPKEEMSEVDQKLVKASTRWTDEVMAKTPTVKGLITLANYLPEYLNAFEEAYSILTRDIEAFNKRNASGAEVEAALKRAREEFKASDSDEPIWVDEAKELQVPGGASDADSILKHLRSVMHGEGGKHPVTHEALLRETGSGQDSGFTIATNFFTKHANFGFQLTQIERKFGRIDLDPHSGPPREFQILVGKELRFLQTMLSGLRKFFWVLSDLSHMEAQLINRWKDALHKTQH